MQEEAAFAAARPIRAKTVLIKRKSLDSWFISRAGMNLYRGCAHDCAYCDGRSESYRVEGDFAHEIVYKENAPEILIRELDPRRRRKPFNPGYLFIGGGVCDSWQPAEKKLRLTRRVLELFEVFPYPLLILTKSTLILRDFDLLAKLNERCRVTVAVSLSSADDGLGRILEPGASLPSERLRVIREAKAAGFGAGVMLLPVVPLITDSPKLLDAAFREAREAGADFAASGSMTLKRGRQWDYFMKAAADHFPNVSADYETVYGPVYDRWGGASSAYYDYFSPLIHEISKRYGLPRRIPASLFPENLSSAERAAIILFQMGDLMRERGLTSAYYRAGGSLAQLEIPLESPAAWKHLRSLGGVGPATERIIKTILDTGTSPVYERLLRGGNPSG